MNTASFSLPASLPGALLALLLIPTGLACGDKDGDSGFDAIIPQVGGNYQVTIGGITGCESDITWVNDWAGGPLKIDQPTGDQTLEFDFGDGYIFPGTVDSTGSYFFAGDIVFNDAELAVQNEGRFVTDPDFDGVRWLMDGDFEIEVDDDEFDTNNCTLTSPMQGVELVDL